MIPAYKARRPIKTGRPHRDPESIEAVIAAIGINAHVKEPAPIPKRDGPLFLERLRELLTYSPETGEFYWTAAARPKLAGKKAGHIMRGQGHVRITVDGGTYMAHRLAWRYVYGSWPHDQIDHINGVRDDNRIANLREADVRGNRQNLRRASRNNRVGLLGVSERKGYFLANIRHRGVSYYLGTWASASDAHNAYLAAKRHLHEFNTL